MLSLSQSSISLGGAVVKNNYAVSHMEGTEDPSRRVSQAWMVAWAADVSELGSGEK